MQEAGVVNIEYPSDDDLNEKLKNIVVTGYSKGGSDESAGVSIQAQKLLKSGQVLNLSVPLQNSKTNPARDIRMEML